MKLVPPACAMSKMCTHTTSIKQETQECTKTLHSLLTPERVFLPITVDVDDLKINRGRRLHGLVPRLQQCRNLGTLSAPGGANATAAERWYVRPTIQSDAQAPFT